jgi:lipoprotein-anchoring transpeptidase ErfK/SrfK
VRRFRVRAPALSLGDSGLAVLALKRELAGEHYALPYVNRNYGLGTYQAALAFQKVHGMTRTGRVTSYFWRVLARHRVPLARVDSGSHIEVDKTRQVMFEVRRGRVARVVHVSTGATGNTPVGRWHVYLKTPGLNSHGMYYSNYFLRGFAIHGYASVPAYPASHGCVRTPMWFAPGFYSRWALGTTVYVFP